MPFPLESKYIDAAEEKLRIRFPDAFRQRMRIENGGELSTPPDAWQLHPFFDSSDRKRIARTTNDIIRETEAARKWSGWPERAIAIGANEAGDRLVFLRTAGDATLCEAALYWWDHETGEVHLITKELSAIFHGRSGRTE